MSNIPPVILFWSLAIGCGGLLLLSAFLAVRRRSNSPVHLKKPPAPQPLVCVECGYNAYGLERGICPECGADLKSTGLASPRFVRMRFIAPWSRCIIWTGCVIVVGLASFGAARDWLPSERLVELTMSADVGSQLMPPDYAARLTELGKAGYAQTPVDSHKVLLTTTHLQCIPSAIWRRSPSQAITQGLEPATAAQLTIIQITLKPLEELTPESTFLVTTRTMASVPVGPTSTNDVTNILMATGVGEGTAAELGDSATHWMDDPKREDAIPWQPNGPPRFRHGVIGGGAGPWRLPYSTIALVISWWLLIWLAGLPMMLRRRPVIGVAFGQAPVVGALPA